MKGYTQDYVCAYVFNNFILNPSLGLSTGRTGRERVLDHTVRDGTEREHRPLPDPRVGNTSNQKNTGREREETRVKPVFQKFVTFVEFWSNVSKFENKSLTEESQQAYIC